MAIYGTALLSTCLLVGVIAGKLIGRMVGVDANVGGVGIAMLLLIATSQRLRAKGWLTMPTQSGVLFWSSIYIPVVVALAATQNVHEALSGGGVALAAGIIVVTVSFILVPLISRLGRPPGALASRPASSGDEA